MKNIKNKPKDLVFSVFILLLIVLFFSYLLFNAFTKNIITFHHIVYFDKFNFTIKYLNNPKEFIFIIVFSFITILYSFYLLYKMDLKLSYFKFKLIYIFWFIMFIILSFPFLGFVYVLISGIL